MERSAAMTNRARKLFNPVRHPGRTVGQKHLSAAFLAPLGSQHRERPEPKVARARNGTAVLDDMQGPGIRRGNDGGKPALDR
jgi:hypothetical protein